MQDVIFVAQTVFSFVTLMFCVGMLADGRDTSVYLPVLTSILGYWLPAPRASPDAAKAAHRILGMRDPDLRNAEASTRQPSRQPSEAADPDPPDPADLDQPGDPRGEDQPGDPRGEDQPGDPRGEDLPVEDSAVASQDPPDLDPPNLDPPDLERGAEPESSSRPWQWRWPWQWP